MMILKKGQDACYTVITKIDEALPWRQEILRQRQPISYASSDTH